MAVGREIIRNAAIQIFGDLQVDFFMEGGSFHGNQYRELNWLAPGLAESCVSITRQSPDYPHCKVRGGFQAYHNAHDIVFYIEENGRKYPWFSFLVERGYGHYELRYRSDITRVVNQNGPRDEGKRPGPERLEVGQELVAKFWQHLLDKAERHMGPCNPIKEALGPNRFWDLGL